MKSWLFLLIASAFLAATTMAFAKDYQVTGPVVDVKDDAIIVKKGNDNWEIARNKDTKAKGEFKKGDRVTIKYKMIATSIEGKEAPKGKAEAKVKADEKTKTEAKAKTK